MNAINSQYNDSLGFNLLECADESMIAELIEVTDQYVHKTQIALQLSPCNLQEANEVHTFSQVMKLLGEDLVTNGNKLHWLSEKLITNLSGDWKEMDNSYTSVDKLDSAQNQTADENLKKVLKQARRNPLLLVNTVVLHHRIQVNVQIVSCQTFQHTVILVLIKVITYLREKKRQENS